MKQSKREFYRNKLEEAIPCPEERLTSSWLNFAADVAEERHSLTEAYDNLTGTFQFIGRNFPREIVQRVYCSRNIGAMLTCELIMGAMYLQTGRSDIEMVEQAEMGRFSTGMIVPKHSDPLSSLTFVILRKSDRSFDYLTKTCPHKPDLLIKKIKKISSQKKAHRDDPLLHSKMFYNIEIQDVELIDASFGMNTVIASKILVNTDTGEVEINKNGLWWGNDGADKVTDNPGPDFECSFLLPSLPEEIQKLEERCRSLYVTPKKLEEAPLDLVIPSAEEIRAVSDVLPCYKAEQDTPCPLCLGGGLPICSKCCLYVGIGGISE